MALKGDRIEHYTFQNIRFFMNEVGNRGGVVCVSTGGSGVSLDNASAVVTYKASASGGKPLGLLLNDMVDTDQTRQHQNWHRNEVQKGGKVTIARKGEFTTDQIASGVTPAAGDLAFLGNEGRITNSNTGAAASPPVGRFLSAKDADGYATVVIDL